LPKAIKVIFQRKFLISKPKAKIFEMSEKRKTSETDSGSKPKRPLPQGIAQIFDDFNVWLRNIQFSRPRNLLELLPQFVANKSNPPNLRLAALFSIPIEKLMKMDFEQRVEAWSKNIIHHLGDNVSHDCYRRWQYNVKLDPMDVEFKDTVKGRLFFADFHNLCNSLGEIGQRLYFEVMVKTWDDIRMSKVEQWTRKETVSESAPFRDAYSLELNSINRFESYGPGIRTPRYPHEDEVLNLLSFNYRITAASKANRSKLIPVEASYVKDQNKAILSQHYLTSNGRGN
jgi:hypothetical protein